MGLKKYSIMTFTDAMDKTFDIHKKHMASSALYLFLYYIISFIAYIIIFFIGIFGFVYTTANLFIGYGRSSIFPGTSLGPVFYFFTIFGIVLALMLLFKFMKQAGIIDIASKAFLNKNVQFEKSLGMAFKKIPAIITIIIGYGLAFLPVIIISAAAVYNFDLIYRDLNYALDSINIWIILLGIIVAIITICLITLYMFSIQAVVIDKLYFLKALKRSRILVKNSFWRLLGINILFYIVVLAITYSMYSFFGVIGGLIILLLKAIGLHEPNMAALLMVGNYIRIPLQIILSIFISPLKGIFTTVLYYNQRFKKEGYDIKLELENLKEEINIDQLKA
ncbi:hypothetical protein [Maledivibacter halophilus]|uniref:Membrane domain of glycerophosphoryl diester phosphodiesterase n=1 Tax=Maledivibacter halophilus TaxID=36842 RepID=A0A1T5J780_9FIRM|nr:hypothetical protein [Maledivibacter halophilus]SKC47093.1 hypothetical protein SAMN02194393_00962 [Maledivibacter halophilus]